MTEVEGGAGMMNDFTFRWLIRRAIFFFYLFADKNSFFFFLNSSSRERCGIK